MRIVNTAVAVALAGSGLLAGGAVALAQPAGEADASAGPSYRATTWHNVNVRICPSTACLPAAGGQILEGRTVGVGRWGSTAGCTASRSRISATPTTSD